MELRFTITASQLDDFAERAKASRQARQARFDRRRERAEAWIERCQRRWLPLLLLVLPLLGSGLVLYLPARRFSIEAGIALAIVSVVYFLLWRRYARRMVDALLEHPFKWRTMLLHRLASKLEHSLDRSNRRRLAALEGCHRIHIAPAGLTLEPPGRKAISLAWGQIAQLRENGEFYQISTRVQKRIGVGYLIARQSPEMDPEAYQAGLQSLVQRVLEGRAHG